MITTGIRRGDTDGKLRVFVQVESPNIGVGGVPLAVGQSITAIEAARLAAELYELAVTIQDEELDDTCHCGHPECGAC